MSANKPSSVIKSSKGQRAHIESNTKGQKKLDKRMMPPQNITQAEFGAQMAKSSKDGYAWQFPVAAYNTGHFIPPDTNKDTDMDLWMQLVDSGLTKDATGKITDFKGSTQWGVPTITPGQMEPYFKAKKEKEAYLTTLNLATKLEDPRDPRTREDMVVIAPELESVPKSYFEQWLADQITLYNLLLDGRIRSREDLMFVVKIVRDDYVIPWFPAWDPSGALLGNIDEFKKILGIGMQCGFFNPRQWSSPDSYGASGSSSKAKQQTVKKLILKRLFPGLKDAPEAELTDIMQRLSQATFAATAQNDAFSFYKIDDGKRDTAMIATAQKYNPDAYKPTP
jgi:hypothetical protein